MLNALLAPLIRRRLASFERTWSYDLGYARDILDADVDAMRVLARAMDLGAYAGGLPPACWYAAKITGAMAEDCGPCTQLVVRMAERAGVPAAVLRAVIAGDDAALPADVRDVVTFARASLARAPADELRATLVARHGARGLVAIAFALAMARVYPTIKYALGHGHACTRVVVDGAPVIPGRPGDVHARAGAA